MAASASDQGMHVVICGGGIIGCSVAYHLAKKGVASTIVDRCGLACAASGKAGGFLARDWCNSYELGPFATKSFDMHLELAKTFADTDFRKVNTTSIGAKEEGTRRISEGEGCPEWLDGPLTGTTVMGTKATTAQVHPYKLTHAMFTAAEKLAGTSLRIGKVEGIDLDDNEEKVVGVWVDGHVVPADVVVIAMGPWSGQASKWLQNVPDVCGQRAHSIVMTPKEPVSEDAIFIDFCPKKGRNLTPEIYPRPDGNVYVAGMGDEHPLPEDPDQVKPNEESCHMLKKIVSALSTTLAEAEVHTKQACYLPISPDDLPVIGKVPEVEGAFIATGHSCWGILNAPATGLALAELITEGKSTTIDIRDFDPARFVS